MTRKEFVKICGLLGLSIPFQASLASGKSAHYGNTTDFKGDVLIIGAGAAGLTAGHLLNQQGIDFQIIEASPVYGGRMKRTLDFVDFPVPLGAEWLHVKRDIFKEIVNDPAIKITTKTKSYHTNVDFGWYEGRKVSIRKLGFKIDQKFIDSSWLDFFEQYIIPSIQAKIKFNQVVEAIDYSQDKVLVNTIDEAFTADKIIITAPVKILQNGAISFTPPLPNDKLNAISKVTVWDGFKAFIEFSEKFYPAAVGFNIKPQTAGQKLYYDASYGQNSTRQVLGLFTVGSGTLPYRQLSDKALIEYMLEELDGIFAGQASANYINHISQNWNNEPFAQGAYVNDHENWRRIRTLGKSVANKLFFAGTAYTIGNDWGSVHTAARSAIRSVSEIQG